MARHVETLGAPNLTAIGLLALHEARQLDALNADLAEDMLCD